MRYLILTSIIIILSSCVSTQVMPLAPNAIQLTTTAKGVLFQGRAVPETMITAARQTLARGYTHFRFLNASLGQGSEISSLNTYGNGNAYFYGSSANISGYSTSLVNRRPTEAASVTVIMLNERNQDVSNSFNARQILRQYEG